MDSAITQKSFYITSTLPYVNSEPHIGFAMEIIRADSIARYKKLAGYDVFFNTGTDEHGQKLFDGAKKEGKDVKEYVDGYAANYKTLQPFLGLSSDIHFIRTTDVQHEKAAQAFWTRCFERGFIYKKNYQMKYCVGCELEKQDSDLENGKCPLHPTYEIELIDEENYFFKFSAFQDTLLAFYDAHPHFVVPDFRFNEIRTFVSRGLQDFSISRLKSKMSWGVAVPNDPDHVMYVWFDALVSYISTLGWPDDMTAFNTYWKQGTPVQYCGKDNLRQQAAMWQAMLMAADLPNTHTIVIDGFITGEGGLKMSKSLGNTVNPMSIVHEYGTDALRYFMVREMSPFEDSPFSATLFKQAYNAHLANGLGNLVSRVVKMAETNEVDLGVVENDDSVSKYADLYERFELKKVADAIWQRIQDADKFIQDNQPFKVVKIDAEKGKAQIAYLLGEIAAIGKALLPIMPETSAKIAAAIVERRLAAPLFLRKD